MDTRRRKLLPTFFGGITEINTASRPVTQRESVPGPKLQKSVRVTSEERKIVTPHTHKPTPLTET